MTDHAAVARQNDIDFRESLRIILRTAGYMRYLKARMAAKVGLITFEHLVRMLILPFPIKIIIDHAILQVPIDAEASGFPSYLAPAVLALRGMSATEIMLWMLLFGILTVVFMGMTLNRTAGSSEGGVGSRAVIGAVRTASAELAVGHDMATQTEQAVNLSTSGMGGLLGIVEFKINLRMSQSLGHLLRTQLADHILKLPMTTLEEQRIGDSTYRVIYDSTSAVWIFHETTLGIYSSLLMLFLAIGVMLTSYGSAPLVIVVGLSVAPLTFLLSVPAAPLVRRVSASSRTSGSETTSNIEEGMSNVLAIQSLGTNRQESKRFSDASAESFRRYRYLGLARALMGIGGLLAFTIGQISFFLLMSGLIIDGTYTPGDYFVVFYYYFVISASSFSFGFLYGDMQSHVAGMARFFHLLDTPADKTVAGIDLPEIRNGLRMENVGLTYPDGRVALRNINLRANVGEIIALVGPTGAGKTTLAYLVPALLQASTGKVMIDGVDLKDVSVDSLRQQVSYVFQETQLFSDSIFENIRYGNKTASRDAVLAAARTAGAHEFIMDLPEGYDTNLGTVTSKLSVGQKQRISIARGLLRESKILILDEPSSALDPETEAYLVDALHDAAKNKLVIIIAHRLSTISQADTIYFLEAGEIQESGDAKTLMSIQGGRFRQFVALQQA